MGGMESRLERFEGSGERGRSEAGKQQLIPEKKLKTLVHDPEKVFVNVCKTSKIMLIS